MRRIKPITLLLGVLLSAVPLLSWTMTWYVVHLAEDGAHATTLSIPGEVAAPALAALGLAGLALVAALAIAGPAFRVVLGILQAAIGCCVALSAWAAIVDPVQASAPLITETTGISGEESVTALVEAASATPWPALTVAVSALMVLSGIV